MKLLDKIKLKLCGDFLSIASLQMQIEDLQLENEELKQKNKTISDNNRSYSKQWEDMFYKDWAEEIYQSEMKQELMEENSELYSQLQEMAKIHEKYKKESNETIQNLENKLIEKDTKWQHKYDRLSKVSEKLQNQTEKEIKLRKELENDNSSLEKQLSNLEKDYTDIIGIDGNGSDIQKMYSLKEKYKKKHFRLKIFFKDLQKDYENLKKELSEKSSKIEELQQRIIEKNKHIIELKSEKDSLLERDISQIKRGDKQYNRFKKAVLKRDNYTCQCCGSTDSPEVHHQFPFVTYNSLGANVNNGITLCKDCHRKYHSKYGINGNTNNPVTFAQFLRDEGKVMQSTLNETTEENNFVLTFDAPLNLFKNTYDSKGKYEKIMEYLVD